MDLFFIQRRRLALTVASLVFLGLGFAVAVARRAEARAERRFNAGRKFAHALVFDHLDAVGKLPGSTPVRQRLVRDALGYLDRLSAEADDPGLIRELVDDYVRIGEVQANSNCSNPGDCAAALASARRAVAMGEKLVRRDAGPSQRQSLACAYDAEAWLLHETNLPADAYGLYWKALALHQAARGQSPRNLEIRLSLVRTLRHLGELGNRGEAAGLNQRITEESDHLVRDFPKSLEARKEAYQEYLSAAEWERSAGHNPAAEEASRKALETALAIAAADPTDTGSQLEVEGAETRLGRQLADDGKAAEGVDCLRKAGSLAQALSDGDPANSLYRRNLGVTEAHLVKAMLQAGDPAGALPHAETALAAAAQWSAGDPGNAEMLSDVALAHRRVGEVMLDLGRLWDALKHHQKSLEILRGIAAGSEDAVFLGSLARGAVDAGEVEWRLHRDAAALDYYRQAVTIGAGLVRKDPDEVFDRLDLAQAQTHLGAAYVRLARWGEARDEYRDALANWRILRDQHALGPEDAHQPEETAAALQQCEGR